jgi:hypothetical protein
MAYKLGKTVARPDAVLLKLATYIKTADLPTPPTTFGWDYLIKPDGWGMLGNDTVGDCVIAGGLHETLLWRKTARHSTALSDAAAIENYSAITGYDPADPSTDQGTDMQVAASYRRKHGLADAHGSVHKIGAYVALEAGNLDQLYAAAWIFGAVGIGIEFPAYAMDDFDQRRPWDVQRTNAKIEGGHYIPAVAKTADFITVVTWGRAIAMTPRFYQKYCDEAVVYLSEEMLTKGVNLDGFNLAQLQADLAAVTSVA